MTAEPFDRADPATAAGLGDRLDDLLLRAETRIAGSPTIVVGAATIVLAAIVAWFALASAAPPSPIEASIPQATPASVTVGAEPAGDGGAAGPAPSSGEGDGGPGASAERSGDEAVEQVIVHVVGAVRRPGLVTLVVGDRISDAVDAAGGGHPDADLDRLNLASPVVDGMQIRVPTVDEGSEDSAVDQPLVKLPPAGGSGAGASSTEERAGSVDLNTADEVELQRLPGIGPALAARIATWRTDNGSFASVDELESVPGIGPAKLAGLRDQATV